MPEHVPNRVLVMMMWLFLVTMTVAAVVFWVLALFWADGVRGLMADIGPGPTALFGSLHIPAAIVGILLLQWRRQALDARARVLLEAATLYFGGMVLFGLFLNFLLVSFFDRAMSG